jgi:hypothetical protein
MPCHRPSSRRRFKPVPVECMTMPCDGRFKPVPVECMTMPCDGRFKPVPVLAPGIW